MTTSAYEYPAFIHTPYTASATSTPTNVMAARRPAALGAASAAPSAASAAVYSWSVCFWIQRAMKNPVMMVTAPTGSPALRKYSP